MGEKGLFGFETEDWAAIIGTLLLILSLFIYGPQKIFDMLITFSISISLFYWVASKIKNKYESD